MRWLLHQPRLLGAVTGALGFAVLANMACASTTLPPRKAGLWETTMTMKMSMNGQPSPMPGPMAGAPIVSAMCTDAATDADEMKKMSGDNGKCSKLDIEGSGDTYTMDGACADPFGGGGVMTTHAVITRESDTEFRVESQTQSAHMSGSMTGDSKWLGACPAGVAPGDIGRMQNGHFVKNLNTWQGQAAPPPPQ